MEQVLPLRDAGGQCEMLDAMSTRRRSQGRSKLAVDGEGAGCGDQPFEVIGRHDESGVAVVDDFVIEIPDARPHVATVVRRLLDLQLIVPCTSGDTSSS